MEILTFTYLNMDFRVKLGGNPRFIEVDNHKGPIKQYWIGPSWIDWWNYVIKQKYTPVIVDIDRVAQMSDPELEFEATNQENWMYFYLPSRNGEQIEKMIANGLLIHLYGVMCFNPETGEFTPPVTPAPLTPTP